MITLFIVILLLISLGMGIYKKRGCLAVLGCALSALLFAGSGILNPLIDRINTPETVNIDTLSGDELIVVLGVGIESTDSGNTPAYFALPRLLAAQRAFLTCKATAHACHILISGGVPTGATESEASVYKRALMQSSVIQDADVSLEELSRNTWENAKYTTAWVKDHPYGQVRLVTSQIHMRRSLAYFQFFGLEPVGEASEATIGKVTGYPTAWNLMAADILFHEEIGLVRFHLYNLLGLNR